MDVLKETERELDCCLSLVEMLALDVAAIDRVLELEWQPSTQEWLIGVVRTMQRRLEHYAVTKESQI